MGWKSVKGLNTSDKKVLGEKEDAEHVGNISGQTIREGQLGTRLPSHSNKLCWTASTNCNISQISITKVFFINNQRVIYQQQK